MLTSLQIDVVMMLSGAVWFGLIGGGLSGALTGAVIRAMRTRRFYSLLPGLFRSALPGAALAIGVSFFATVLQMLLCKPGHNTGWDVPVWAISAEMIAIFVAGVIGAFVSQHIGEPRLLRRSKIVWTFVGAFLGALASLCTSFDGYYVLESNARPIIHAAVGFVIGGIVVLLWRGVIERLEKDKDETTSAS